MAILLDAGSAEGPARCRRHRCRHIWTSTAGGRSARRRRPTLHRALILWTRLHGVLSLEIAGHFAGMEFDPAPLYAAEVEAVAGS